METPGKAAKRARDREGRFCGPRFNLEKVPRLPTFPARWALADPYGRPYFVFWTTEDGALSYSLHMARTDRGTAVQVTMPNGASRPIRIVRRPLPSGTGTMILYCCPICEKPRRYLYRLVRTADGLADYFGLQCQACAGLRWASQGRYRNSIEREVSSTIDVVYGRRMRGLVPRYPWEPRAVSDPRMVVAAFPHLLQEAGATPVPHDPVEQVVMTRPGTPPPKRQRLASEEDARGVEELSRLFASLGARGDFWTGDFRTGWQFLNYRSRLVGWL